MIKLTDFSEFGLSIGIEEQSMEFKYYDQTVGPVPELRYLDSIRSSLKNPQCDGPNVVYSIAMDVAQQQHLQELQERMLLFGVVTYAKGQLGNEPIRSQGHIHRVSAHSGWSPPELYEIWEGEAIIYMQEYVNDNPGRCYAVYAEKGDKVLVPPGWGHATISANPAKRMTFGAWCDREYGFEYDAVRSYQGLAWYPVINDGSIVWEANPKYQHSTLQQVASTFKSRFGINNEPIYKQFEKNPECLKFISKPAVAEMLWHNFKP